MQEIILKIQYSNQYLANILTGVGFIITFLFPTMGKTQNMPFPPPNQMQVFTVQHLNFGSFFNGTGGGQVILSPEGFRTSTGSVLLAAGTFHQAIFDLRLIPGRWVQIQLGPATTLEHQGGGGSMSLTIGPTDRGTGFVTTGGHPFRNPVKVGGTLTVGNSAANPPGNYSGTFYITFIQE